MISSRIMLAVIPLALASPASAQGTAEQRAACGPDAVRLCASSIPNVSKVSACLHEKREQLSTACQTVMDQAGAAAQPQVAETPPASEPQSTAAKVEKPGGEKSEQARSTEPNNAQRTASARAPLRFDARQDNASASSRRQTASRRVRNQRDADAAEAVYWLRRVTGYSGPVNTRAFERISQGNFSSLMR